MRAALVLAYLMISVLLLLPSGSRMYNRKVWKTPHNQEQFAQWAEALNRFGFGFTPKSFEDQLWKLTQKYHQLQRPITRTVAPFARQLGVGQSWRMFSNPQTHPGRLYVETDRGDGWQKLFVSRSDEFTWRRQQFDHNRMRKLIGRVIRGGRYAATSSLLNWISNEVQRDFPDTERTRVRIYRWHTPAIYEAGPDYDKHGKFYSTRVKRVGKHK